MDAVETLNILLKYQTDIAKATKELSSENATFKKAPGSSAG